MNYMMKEMMLDMAKKTKAKDIGLKVEINPRTKKILNKFGTTEEEYMDAVAGRGMKKVTTKVMEEITSSNSKIGSYVRAFGIWS